MLKIATKHCMHAKFFYCQICRPFQRGPRRKKSIPAGISAVARSIPAVFPQHSDPYPRETRGFREIPAVPIPMHTSRRESVRSVRFVSARGTFCITNPYRSVVRVSYGPGVVNTGHVGIYTYKKTISKTSPCFSYSLCSYSLRQNVR